MREVWKKYPNDADVGAFFAESMMDLAAVEPVDTRRPAKPRAPKKLSPRSMR